MESAGVAAREPIRRWRSTLRRRRRANRQHAKPAYALAALFFIEYLIGVTAQNVELAVAVLVIGGVLAWLLAVLVDALDLRSSGAWLARSARRHIKREARRAEREAEQLNSR